jgi:TatD DNase family protein
MLIDTHAHVQFSGFKGEEQEVIQRALDNGVWVINTGTQIDTSKAAVDLLSKFDAGVYAVVGLHPVHTYQQMLDEEESHFRTREEEFDYAAYKELVSHPRVIGIGECGLDYYRLPEGTDHGPIKEKQQAAFLQQIDLACAMDKALVIHCRPSPGTMDAYEDILAIMEKAKQRQPRLRFEVHSFTGTLAVAEKFVALGGFIAANGIITFDKTGRSEEVIKALPLESLIVETDCPYLAPVPMRGKKNEPAFVKYVAEKIAEWKELTFEHVAEQTTENAKKLFSI